MFTTLSTEDLVRSILMLILDGHTENPDFQPMFQEAKKRLGI